jgi:hypothetical protein
MENSLKLKAEILKKKKKNEATFFTALQLFVTI